MKQLIFFLLLALSANTLLAQDEIKIDLADWKGKKESIPFTINQVTDSRPTPNQIGTIEKTTSKKTAFNFASNSALMIQQFINTQFDQENEMNVLMQIEVLEIVTVKIKGKEVAGFNFACKFYKKGDQTQEPLYTFNAHNSVTHRKALKLAMTNYIGRALTTAILNFKKSYLKHPEWQKENTSAPEVTVKKTIHYNEMQAGDTIALDGKYKLQSTDFSAAVDEGEKDEAFSTFIITYTLDAEDNNNNISIAIYPKAFFLRSSSWSKKSDSTNWLAHQQLLFDLASYHASRFKKALEKHNFSAGFYKAEANQIYNEISGAYFDEMDLLQGETKFGSLAAKEAAWRKKVDAYLSSY